MRSTIHVVSAADYWPFAVAIRRERAEWWRRAHSRSVGDADMPRVEAAVRQALERCPRRRDELLEVIRGLEPERVAPVWHGLALELVRVPPSGTWERRRADLYATAESWLDPPAIAEPEALDHLLRRYLAAFGPASLADAAGWAGTRTAALRASAERLRLRTFEDESGRTLLDLPRAPLPDADTPVPVRFLPTFDATLLVQARRTQILPERFRPLIFDTKTPQSTPTFLVDGAVAGAWRVERTDRKATLRLTAFEPLPRSARTELREEAERLVRFHEASATSYAVRG
jgi:hypothetical protein